MKLEELGYNEVATKYNYDIYLNNFEPGRITAEHKERYIVHTLTGEFEAEITGNMRYSAQGREDFPAVGDWVALQVFDSDFALIHMILPRYSIIKRQAVGKHGEVQIIATNIDFAYIIQSVDRDFNINRMERYMTICNTSGVKPIIILSKTDLISKETLSEIIDGIKSRLNEIDIFALSNENMDGLDELKATIIKGKTYCMLGSSGVGKSTLLNNLAGKTVMKTDSISTSSNRGKHTTSRRELVILDNGAIMIDNPGMREVGISDTSEGLETTFDKIANLSKSCKYADCTHVHEKNCAVVEAVNKGDIDADSYHNYLKMLKERSFFETSVADKRKKEKIFGKILKDYKKKNIKEN